jgi:S-adenosylmethionine decarboxylase
MPGDSAANRAAIQAAGRYAELRRDEARTPKKLYAVDGHVPPGAPVTDVAQLTAIATAAVRAGNGHVLETSHVLFPNGAVTLVLILAESHLSLHTWPEESLIAIDLFSCGAIDGETVLARLTGDLGLTDMRAQQIDRGSAR